MLIALSFNALKLIMIYRLSSLPFGCVGKPCFLAAAIPDVYFLSLFVYYNEPSLYIKVDTCNYRID